MALLASWSKDGGSSSPSFDFEVYADETARGKDYVTWRYTYYCRRTTYNYGYYIIAQLWIGTGGSAQYLWSDFGTTGWNDGSWHSTTIDCTFWTPLYAGEHELTVGFDGGTWTGTPHTADKWNSGVASSPDTTRIVRAGFSQYPGVALVRRSGSWVYCLPKVRRGGAWVDIQANVRRSGGWTKS